MSIPTNNLQVHLLVDHQHRSQPKRLFKKVDVNIPLLDLIRQLLAYAQFLKSLCTTMKRLQDNEKYEIKEEVSAHKLPPKMQDPESFTIGCTIGEKKLMELSWTWE